MTGKLKIHGTTKIIYVYVYHKEVSFKMIP